MLLDPCEPEAGAPAGEQEAEGRTVAAGLSLLPRQPEKEAFPSRRAARRAERFQPNEVAAGAAGSRSNFF